MSTKLNVLVVTQDDPFYVPLLLKKFFEELDEDVTVSRIVCLDPFNESFPELVARTYRLFGAGGFLRHGVAYVIRSFFDTIGVRRCSVDGIAESYNIPVDHVQSVNRPEFVNGIQQEGVDVVLSVSAPEIFDESLLSAPNWGCLNVHTAELPKYRGMMPTFWALYHGETEVGVTIHEMVEELDAGRVAAQTTFDVTDLKSLHEVICRGKQVGGELAAETLARIARDEISLSEMTGSGSYHSFPTVKERRELESRGWRMR
jgi:methionyl-tRNA formyltransferase